MTPDILLPRNTVSPRLIGRQPLYHMVDGHWLLASQMKGGGVHVHAPTQTGACYKAAGMLYDATKITELVNSGKNPYESLEAIHLGKEMGENGWMIKPKD